MRPRLVLAFFLVCVPASLLAQTPDESANDAPAIQATPQTKPPALQPATAAITGTVFCNDTHRPARGAVVIAQPIPKSGNVDVNLSSAMGRVGMDGTYTIQQIRPDDYSVVAFLPGYFSLFDDLPADQTDNNNDPEMRARLARNGVVSVHNNETAHLDITIQRGASLSGRVLYDDGSPATQVTMKLEDVNAKPPASKPVPHNTDSDLLNVDTGTLIRSLFLHQPSGTDDQGNFRISGIKPGTYRLAAAPSTASQNGDPDEVVGLLFGSVATPGELRIYSGDTLHKNKAKTYDLRAGDDITGIEITIPVYAFHRVEGHLVTLDGRPILSAVITLTNSSDDSFLLHSRPVRDGAFVFPEVPSGTYKLAIAEAKLGAVAADLPADQPIPATLLQNIQSFADKTTTVLVKDSDIIDLTIQLQNAPRTPNQPPPEPASNSSPEDNN